MLDMHPEPEQSRIEVQAGVDIVQAGLLDDPTLIHDIHAASAVL